MKIFLSALVILRLRFLDVYNTSRGSCFFLKLCSVIQSFGVNCNYVHSLYILRSLNVVIEIGIQFKHSLSKAYNKEKLCN